MSEVTRAPYHATVHDILLDDRPHERLQKYGADLLSPAELLAIILRTGTAGENVLELTSKLHRSVFFSDLIIIFFLGHP